MITYKITTAFQADWDNLFKSLFGSNQHVYSQVSGNEGVFGFSDASVTPADLGPLVKVEIIPNP
jgi:hypothetical protein